MVKNGVEVHEDPPGCVSVCVAMSEAGPIPEMLLHAIATYVQMRNELIREANKTQSPIWREAVRLMLSETNPSPIITR